VQRLGLPVLALAPQVVGCPVLEVQACLRFHIQALSVVCDRARMGQQSPALRPVGDLAAIGWKPVTKQVNSGSGPGALGLCAQPGPNDGLERPVREPRRLGGADLPRAVAGELRRRGRLAACPRAAASSATRALLASRPTRSR
jgi:hypothetical protein